MASKVEKKQLTILIYTDETVKHPAVDTKTKYHLIMQVLATESPWTQIRDLLTEVAVGEHCYILDVEIEGALGRKSLEYVRELAEQVNTTGGRITWRIYAASVEAVKKELGSLITVETLPV
jgi:hypothetical protein